MTLIITTLTPRGIVIAADRRTTSTNHKNGEKLVLSDLTTKILIGSDIAVAIVGASTTQKLIPEDVVEHWLTHVYNADRPFRDQAEAFYNEQIKAVPGAGFVAACYRSAGAECFRTNIDGEVEYDHLTEPLRARMKFNGSGNTLAGQLVDMSKPPLASFPLADVVNYSTFLISATHSVQKFAKHDMPTVGEGAIVAVIDYRGAQLVHGGDYRFDAVKV